MKALGRGALSAVLALAICGIGGPPAQAADTLVNVPDPTLQACIQRALTAKSLTAELNAGNLALLTSVVCLAADGAIADLTGVEHLSGITSLAVYGSTVTDLSPVTGLPALRYLRVDSTRPYDLLPVESLPSLTTLRVTLQQDADPAPLSRLEGLESLQVKTDLPLLPDLQTPSTVRELVIFGSNLVDLGHLSGGTGVSVLFISAARLTTLKGVAGLTSVEDLTCSGAQISDLSAVAGMANLSRLRMGENQITDVSPLGTLSRLRELDLDNNRLTDLAPLAGLPALTILSAMGNQLTTLGPDGGLARLTNGYFGTNHLTDITALRGAPLRALTLMDNQISDLRPLSGVPTTAYVQFQRNQVKDLSPLPDTVHYYADGQVPAFPASAKVGEPVDLGIRDVLGSPLCPSFTPAVACVDGVVTYESSGTYNAELNDSSSGLAFVFTQHAGPDRPFTSTPAPIIDKVLHVGSSMSPRLPAWAPPSDPFTYEWFRDGVPIVGLDPLSSELGATVGDLGHKFMVCVTGSLDGYLPARRCSDTGTVVAGFFGYPSYPPIQGVAITDSVLNVDPSFWQPGVMLTYQWQKNGRNIRGATAATYRVRAGDVGDSLRAIVTGSMEGYRPIGVFSQPVRPKKAHFTAPVPVVTGMATVGRRLIATPGAWTPASGHLSYRWYRNGKAISHATKATYLLKAKDRGKVIKVRVSASRAGYVTKRVYSLPTAKVA